MKLVREPTAKRALRVQYPKWKVFFLKRGNFLQRVKHYIQGFYAFLIACLVLFLRKRKRKIAALFLGALLLEPLYCLRKFYDYLKGFKKNYNEYGLNPNFLKECHIKKSPILFLQGRNGSQSSFRYLASVLAKKALTGPIFTVNLPSGELKMSDLHIIDKKIKNIQSLYKEKPVSITLIGYSRGAELALYGALPNDVFHIKDGGYCYSNSKWKYWRPEVGKIIRIGSMTLLEEWEALAPKMQSSIYEIRGCWDVLMPDLAYSKNTLTVQSGHVGLLYSQEVIEYLIEQLKS